MIGAIALIMQNVLLTWVDSNVGATFLTNTNQCTSMKNQNQPKVTYHRRAPSVEMLQVNKEKEYKYQFLTKINASKHTNHFLKVLQFPKFYITEKNIKMGDTLLYLRHV